ncbi:MAG: TIGR03545 family protein, partial [Bdellovibrio sp.]
FGKGGSVGSLPSQWEQQLTSKAHLAELEKFVQSLQKKWPQEFAKLPQAGVFESFKQRGAQIKTSGFSNPQELQTSVQHAQSLLKDIDSEVQKIQTAQKALGSDLASLDEGTKKLPSLVDSDLNSLQSKMGIPAIDAKSLVKGLVMDAVNPHLQRLQQAQAQMQKYLPPNLKNKEGKPDNSIKPHPRGVGVSYEFGRPLAYPLFWVKKILISSKSTPTGFSGDVSGSLTDISSNQMLSGRPSKLALQAEFPRQGVLGLKVDASLDQRGVESRMDFATDIQSYLLSSRTLVQSPDVNIGYETGRGALKFRAHLRDLKNFSYSAENQFNSLALQVSSANVQAQEVLRNIFSAIPVVTLDIWGEAELPNFPININSNLGPAFARAFEKELQRMLAEVRSKIESEVQRLIGEQRKKLDLQIQAFRGPAELEVKKAQGQADDAKGRVEAQVAQARKDFEDQAQREKKKLEEQVKRSLGQDADKKLDELKKKLNISI